MMSTTGKDALATNKECLYLHQPLQPRKMPEQKEHIYNSMYYVIVKEIKNVVKKLLNDQKCPLYPCK